jgi:hypothetical protein
MIKSLHNSTDSELIEIAKQVVSAIGADPAAYGASAAEITELSSLIAQFQTDTIDQKAKVAAAKAATTKRKGSRLPLLAAIRTRRSVARAAGATESAMALTGIPVASDKMPASATVPAGAVDTSERLRHRIHWTDAAALHNKRKPRGAMGVEIWLKLGDTSPGSEKDCSFLTIDSRASYVAEYNSSDAGKTAHYMFRWRMRDGSVSAWGETVSATVTG